MYDKHKAIFVDVGRDFIEYKVFDGSMKRSDGVMWPKSKQLGESHHNFTTTSIFNLV